jgi:hypothetical protein
MSVNQTRLVWEYSRHGGAKRLLMLALADHADPEGICWPSIARLALMIYRTERQTQYLLQEVLKANPTELIILEPGGRGRRLKKSHLFKIVVKPHANGLTAKLKALRDARGGQGEENFTLETDGGQGEENFTHKGEEMRKSRVKKNASKGEAHFTQTTIEPPTTNHHTTTTAAAAVDMGNGEWNWKALGTAAKLPKKHLEELTGAACPPQSFVGLYLYGLSAPGIRTPNLWASRKLSDNPQLTAGQPYEPLAEMGPSKLAQLCGWIRDGGPLPDFCGRYTDGAALAWRGLMSSKFNRPEALGAAADQAINELGLSGLVVAPEPLRTLEREPAAPAPELDVWERMLANGLRADMSEAALIRLRRCHLVADNGPEGIVVGVPAAHDYDWLSRQLATKLRSLHRVELVPAYSK